MEHKAAVDHAFLSDVGLDQAEFFSRWAPVIEDSLGHGCALFISNSWIDGFAVSGGLLDFGMKPPIKELRNFAMRVMQKMHQSSSPICEGRATHKCCLQIRDGAFSQSTITCGDDDVQISHAGSKSAVSDFWRERLSSDVDVTTFEQFVPVAFSNLELGPEARGNWGRLGHAFTAIRRHLVVHLSYLNDRAANDWASAAYSDSQFTALAGSYGVLLSRDGKNNNSRDYPDDIGTTWDCRHHTKLNPDNTGRSAHFGGRIYFCIRVEASVFVGKICEHD